MSPEQRRVLLRLLEPGDAEILYPLVANRRVTDTLSWDGPVSLDDLREALDERRKAAAEGRYRYYTIVEAATGQPTGCATLRPLDAFRADIGLWIGEPYWGKGYGTETIRQIVELGFGELPLEKIEATVFEGNWGSRRIFEKNGFQLEGTIRRSIRKRGVLLDQWLLGLLREEYE